MNFPFKKSPIVFNQALLSPSNIFDLLPGDHECFVYRDLFDQLDTSTIEGLYSDKGQHAYHPKQIVSILIYSYSRGVFSSREIERRCYEDISFMYIVLDRKVYYLLYNNKLCYDGANEEGGLTQQAAIGQNIQAIDNKVQ